MKFRGRGYGRLRTVGVVVISGGAIVGGFFQPLFGLIVPILVVAAAIGSLVRKRWFCSSACPRGALLGSLGPRYSRYRALPASLKADKVRTALCGFLLVCTVGQTARNWDSLGQLGRFFWFVCALSLVVALVMAYFFKPRSWCAICPVGALQDNVARRSRSGERAEEAGAEKAGA